MRKALGLTLCLAIVVAVAAPARAQVSTVDLLTDAGTQIDGAAADDRAGRVGGGDLRFDADTEVDVVVGAPVASPLGRTDAGSAWVLLGRLPMLVDLLGPPAAVRIDGAAAGDRAGIAVAGAGDVNGDGFDDVVIGADGADPLGRGDAGTAWIVLGGDTTPVDLAAIGTRGFRIDGPVAGAEAGTSVDGAGDVNGDGLADVIVGAPFDDPDGRTNAGTAFVVFGKADTAPVDLAALGTGGYPIRGGAPRDRLGASVAGAGSLDGDGFADLLVGAPGADNDSGNDAGAAFLLYGKANTTPVDIAALGSAGYGLRGGAPDENLGFSVADAGDIDRDGSDDQIVGVPGGGGGIEGRAEVYYGLEQPPSKNGPFLRGYLIMGSAPGDATGHRVAGLGDVSADFRPDQVVGAPDSDNGGRAESGSAYVVHGLEDGTTIHLPSYGSTLGYRIDGPSTDAHAGRSVAGAGDAAGEPGRDVLVGAPGNDANGRATSGSVYLVGGATALEVVRHVRVDFVDLNGGSRSVPPAAARAVAAGAVLRLRLSRPASVTTILYRRRHGRTVGRFREVGGELAERVRCVRGRPRGKGQRRCRRFDRLGRVHRVRLGRGRHRVPFGLRFRGRRLEPGAYVLEVRARDRQGRVHGPKRAGFRLVR